MATARSSSGPRRHHLEMLAREVAARGLWCRLIEDDQPLLRVSDPYTGRVTMVAAVAASRHEWTYLWGGGGQAGTGDPAYAAALIAQSLGR